jgi:hypothetical protein
LGTPHAIGEFRAHGHRSSLARDGAAPRVLLAAPARDGTRRVVSPLSYICIAEIAHRARDGNGPRAEPEFVERSVKGRDPDVNRTPKTPRIQHPPPLIDAAVVRQRSDKTRQHVKIREVIPATWYAKFVGCLGGKQGNFYAVLGRLDFTTQVPPRTAL